MPDASARCRVETGNWCVPDRTQCSLRWRQMRSSPFRTPLHAQLLLLCVAPIWFALVAQAPTAARPSARPDGIDSTLARLYESFSFQKGNAPAWTVMRHLFLDGATIVDPVRPGTVPHAVGIDRFLSNFRKAVARAPSFRNGFVERILVTRVDSFGNIAHAYVTFEGFAPAHEAEAIRGVDSIQLFLVGSTWKVASFTTQYEKKDLPLPARFLRDMPDR